MNDTLKVAGRIGAELGAAKAENDRLRGLLRQLRALLANSSYRISGTAAFLHSIDAALSQQPEPTDTFTAVDMAAAAAQGFRDGQAAVEQAAAQDEREALRELISAVRTVNHSRHRQITVPDDDEPVYWQRWEWIGWILNLADAAEVALANRPAQTEQQPIAYADPQAFVNFDKARREGIEAGPLAHEWMWANPGSCLVPLYAAPIAQTAPQGKFRLGDLVKKSTGSEWVGRVVGTYSTEQTKEGYAVESSAHRNSVQIYPVTALEAVE